MRKIVVKMAYIFITTNGRKQVSQSAFTIEKCLIYVCISIFSNKNVDK